MNDDAEIEALMRRCQQGFAGRPSVVYEQANQFAAACYGTIGKLKLERDALAEELSIRNGGPSKLMQGMQRIGWPCGAVELPQEFLKLTAQLTYTRNAYEELRRQRDAVTRQFINVQAELETQKELHKGAVAQRDEAWSACNTYRERLANLEAERDLFRRETVALATDALELQSECNRLRGIDAALDSEDEAEIE